MSHKGTANLSIAYDHNLYNCPHLLATTNMQDGYELDSIEAYHFASIICRLRITDLYCHSPCSNNFVARYNKNKITAISFCRVFSTRHMLRQQIRKLIRKWVLYVAYMIRLTICRLQFHPYSNIENNFTVASLSSRFSSRPTLERRCYSVLSFAHYSSRVCCDISFNLVRGSRV